MGSFNVSCALTSDFIKSGDQAVVLLINARHRNSPLTCYNWDNYSPVPILLSGEYNGYGGLNNVKLFNSGIEISDINETLIREKLVDTLKKQTSYDTNYSDIDEPKTMDDFFNVRDWAFKKSSGIHDAVNMVLSTIESMRGTMTDETLDVRTMEFLEALGVKSIEEAQKLATTKSPEKLIPINFVFMKEKAVNYLLNNFALTDAAVHADENYSIMVQRKRKNNTSLSDNKELMAFMNGTQGYAGENTPLFNFEKLRMEIKNLDLKKYPDLLKDTNTLYVRQALDFTLINEYMNVLGKTWQPSMSLSEDIQNYGHKEAFSFQKDLLQSMNKNSLKP